MTVSQTGTVAQWVQNVLIGPGITVSNVTYTGDAQAIGTFTTGNIPTNLGFGSGIILSSGSALSAPGPNNSGSQTTNTSGGSDPQLAQLISTTASNIKDAAVLQFDFIPVADTVKFRYVFGSEEYDEYVGSSYNDVFGFFVSGLNPYSGYYTNINIAKIPNTNTPVSINNVNNGSSNAGPCNNCAFYTHNYGQSLQYDGKTVVLTAWIQVIPCLTYHIKLAVADVGDESYDSGVFLEANSFMSNAVVIDQSTSNTIDTSAVEGCNDAIVTFRIPQIKPVNTIINFLAVGTATNGVDYTNIGSSIIIPAFQDSVNMIIHPIIDGITEPTEMIMLVVNTSACTYDTVYIQIKDNSLTVPTVSNDTILCDNSTAVINATAVGGYSPYTYNWSNGDTTSQIVVSPLFTTTYTVTVNDLCNNDSTDFVVVKVSKPNFTIMGDSICKNDIANLIITPTGILTYNWNTGANTPTINVSPDTTTIYLVTITDTLGCFVDTSTIVNVWPSPIVEASNDTIICSGKPIELIAGGGQSYLWNSGQSTQSIFLNPTISAIYTVTVATGSLCKGQASIKVEVVDNPLPIITSSKDTICKGSMATLNATGGETYLWNTGSFSDFIEVMPEVSTLYSVVASNSKPGLTCSDTAIFSQGVKRCNRFYVPNAFTPNGDGLNDDFGIYGIFENIDAFEMQIYDRWGKLVFITNDITKKWNGQVDGQKPMDGVYVYSINIHETFSQPYVLTGTVHLVK
ncbi:MAG: hypothetical protein AUJ98_07505 [Bacteroidetes bacterium CG2_30_33_31]|nr:MAG: hypothetical protein AUJ98_07505 [Bacteroidetes bacterium CG2_30_33_31]